MVGAAVRRRKGGRWRRKREKEKKSNKATVHIFPVKTGAAEGGYGRLGGGSGDDGNLPVDILCVL